MVSVIVPAYNMEKYLAKCLDSLLVQSYTDQEILVIDDGSKDRTYDIACEYAGKDGRIKAFHKENGGVSSARNLGIEKATGEYILFLDPDDLIEADSVEVLVQSMEDGGDLVSCQYSRWTEDGQQLEDYNFITGKRVLQSDEDRIRFILDELLDYHVGYEVWDKLFKTAIIRENRINFSERCRIGEDLAFVIKYLINIKEVNNISDRCIRYNIRGNSAMGEHTALSRKIEENNLLLEDVRNYVIETGKKIYLDRFPLVCVKLMEKAYIGHTPVEIVEACKQLEDVGFMKDRYEEIEEKKADILAIYPGEIAKLKFKYHMFVKAGICGEKSGEKLKRKIYNCYRKLRGRETLENWKMPY
jgi:glycosyltransferase involved in cell wall biosynthesis